MGQFEDEEVSSLIERAEKLVCSSSSILAGFNPGRNLSEMFHSRNYSLVVGCVDLAMLRTAALSDLEAARASKIK